MIRCVSPALAARPCRSGFARFWEPVRSQPPRTFFLENFRARWEFFPEICGVFE